MNYVTIYKKIYFPNRLILISTLVIVPTLFGSLQWRVKLGIIIIIFFPPRLLDIGCAQNSNKIEECAWGRQRVCMHESLQKISFIWSRGSESWLSVIKYVQHILTFFFFEDHLYIIDLKIFILSSYRKSLAILRYPIIKPQRFWK